jgi:hypothetical protein
MVALGGEPRNSANDRAVACRPLPCARAWFNARDVGVTLR